MIFFAKWLLIALVCLIARQSNKMIYVTTNQREDEILRELTRSGGSSRITALANKLGVTKETIRRNIRTLEEKNVVRKVHGGVHFIEDLSEPNFENRLERKTESKNKLGTAVAKIIEDGDSVFLDISSTTAYVALALKNHNNLLVVTNSAFVASTLSTRNNNKVFMAGGELRSHDGGAFGVEAHDLINRLNVRLAILSVGAINNEHGFMLHDLQEANLARLAMRKAQICLVVADSDKFGKRAPVSMEGISNVDLLITESEPPNDIREMLDRYEIEVVIADDS